MFQPIIDSGVHTKSEFLSIPEGTKIMKCYSNTVSGSNHRIEIGQFI